MSPVSKLVPSSAVAVCAVLSWLATLMRVPLSTVSEAGENLKFEMVSAPEPLLGFGAEDPVDVAAWPGRPDCVVAGREPELPQAAIGPGTVASATSEAVTWRRFTGVLQSNGEGD